MLSGVSNAYGFDPQLLAQRREQLFKKADTNGDGSLSQEEFVAAAPKNGRGPDPAELFKTIDSNSDGKIDKSELETFDQKIRQAHQGGPKAPPDIDGENPLLKLLTELQQAFSKSDSSNSDSETLLKKLQQIVQDIIEPLQQTAPYTKAGVQEFSAGSALVSLQV